MANLFASTDQVGIIIAADVDSLTALGSLLGLTLDLLEVKAVKVGFSLALRYGLSEVVKTIREMNPTLSVIYDHQKAGTDIPQMAAPFVAACKDSGVESFIIFPQAGPKTLEAFVLEGFRRDIMPIVGLIMSHPSYLQSEGGYISDEAPASICALALQLGVRLFVLPGTKPRRINEFASGPLLPYPDISIMMPGIGSQGGSIKEAFEAARPHRRFAIVGSAIYNADNPREALMGILKEARE